MNWTKSLNSIAKNTKCSSLLFQKFQYSTFRTEQNLLASLQADTGCAFARSVQRAGYVSDCFVDALRLRVKREWRVKLPCDLSSNIAQRKYAMLISCQYSHGTNNDQGLSRDFFVKLWIKDKERKCYEERQRQRAIKRAQFCSQGPRSPTEDPFLGQLPTSESLTGALRPSSPEEVIFLLCT